MLLARRSSVGVLHPGMCKPKGLFLKKCLYMFSFCCFSCELNCHYYPYEKWVNKKQNKTHSKWSAGTFNALMSCLVWSERVWVNVHEIAETSVILLNDPAQSFSILSRERSCIATQSVCACLCTTTFKANTPALFTHQPSASRAKGYCVSKSTG